MVEEDVIVLDLRTDGYACLPGLSDEVRLFGNGLEADAGILADLEAIGLLSASAGQERRSPPPLPTWELGPGQERRSILDGLLFLQAVRAMGRLGRAAPVQACISALPPSPARPADVRRVRALVRTFQRLLPWTPGQGACLYRASVLLWLLRRAGQDADWVFGVRTWPFEAHCWLQIGEAVLDDDPERVAVYTPIMVV